MTTFCHTLFWGEEKIVQNTQTEHKKPLRRLFVITRSCMSIQREAKFVRSIKHFN